MSSFCLKDKMEELDKQISDTKLNNRNCSSTDISYNKLLSDNSIIKKKLHVAENINNDGQKNVIIIPVLYISIFYTIIFFVIGIFYNNLITSSIIKIIGNLSEYLDPGNNSDSYNKKWQEINKCLNLFRFYLFIIVFLIVLVINVAFIYILILNGSKIKHAMKAVSITIIAVIGVTFLLINNINFVKIFENTIGYSIAKFFPPQENVPFDKFINKLFIHDNFQKGGINFDFLFPSFRLDNIGHILNDIGTSKKKKYDFHLNSIEENDLQTLIKLVTMKNTVGHICWILFSSIATTIISVKYLTKI
jgi:hypothetical protein